MFCLVVGALLSVLLIGMIKSLTFQTSAIAAAETSDRAAYLADAGVEHAIEVLQRDRGWTGTLTWDDRHLQIPDRSNVGRYVVHIRHDSTGQILVGSTGDVRGMSYSRHLTLPEVAP